MYFRTELNLFYDYAQMIFFIKKGLYYAEFFEKLFMRNPKHYIVSGPSVPEKDFTNKRNARKFLFQNSENGYDAMIDCLDTDPCCK